MLLPTVIEILHRPEPTTRDTFIAGLGAAAARSTRPGPKR
jgi:hypothetical protein